MAQGRFVTRDEFFQFTKKYEADKGIALEAKVEPPVTRYFDRTTGKYPCWIFDNAHGSNPDPMNKGRDYYIDVNFYGFKSRAEIAEERMHNLLLAYPMEISAIKLMQNTLSSLESTDDPDQYVSACKATVKEAFYALHPQDRSVKAVQKTAKKKTGKKTGKAPARRQKKSD